MKYSLNLPSLSSLEKKYVLDVLKSGWLSSNGTHTQIFQQKFSKIINRKYSLAVQSGTAALHLALKSLNCNAKDKVIIPNYTCVSNISSVAQCSAIPIIVEVEKETLGLDYELVKKAIEKYKPKILQLVHVYGHPARDTIKIINLCKIKGVKVIEDASEALGAKINNKKIGSFGDISVFSTRSEKMIGVGEGGMISTNNNILFEIISLLASRKAPFRKKKDPYWKKYFHLGEGYNYLLPHLLGAVGRAQIERFPTSMLLKKKNVGNFYKKIFKGKTYFLTQKNIKNSTPVFWLNSLFFKDLNKKEVIQLAYLLEKKGIEVRSGFWPMSELKGFNSIYLRGKEKVSKNIFEKSLVLPSNVNLKYSDILKFKKEIDKNLPKRFND